MRIVAMTMIHRLMHFKMNLVCSQLMVGKECRPISTPTGVFEAARL